MNSIKKFSANSSLTVMVALLIAIASFGANTSVAVAADLGGYGDLGGGFDGYYGGMEVAPDTYFGGMELAPDNYYGGMELAYDGYYGGMELAPDDYYGGMELAYDDYYGGMELAYDDYYGGMELSYDNYDSYDMYEITDTYGYSYGSQGGFGSGFTTGGGYSMPSYPSYSYPKTSSYPSYPTTCYHCNQPAPKPTPSCSTCGGGSNTNITNTNINHTNTIIDNSIVDNSINDSFNTVISNSGNTNITTLGTVIPQPIIQYQQQYAAPYCVITLTSGGMYNAQATLVWSSSNAQTAYISSIGNVAVNGTRTVTGYSSQIYSLTVTGQGGSYTCQTQYTPTYVPPTYQTPTVSLTQIPYTGLDMGPVGNAMYWLAILSVAAAGGYLLTYHSGNVMALATSAIRSRSQNHIVVSETESDVEAPVTPVVEEETAEVTPSTNILNFLPTMVATMTKDTMTMARATDGTPRLVISRA